MCKKYGGIGYAIGGGFSPALPPNKAFAADGTDSAFFGVDFGTLSFLVSSGFVAAAEMQALGGWKERRYAIYNQ